MTTEKTEFLQRNVGLQARRLVQRSWGNPPTDDNLRAAAATVALLTEMRKVAAVHPLTGEDLQTCIDTVMTACNIEAFDLPMGGEALRFKS